MSSYIKIVYILFLVTFLSIWCYLWAFSQITMFLQNYFDGYIFKLENDHLIFPVSVGKWSFYCTLISIIILTFPVKIWYSFVMSIWFLACLNIVCYSLEYSLFLLFVNHLLFSFLFSYHLFIFLTVWRFFSHQGIKTFFILIPTLFPSKPFKLLCSSVLSPF